MNLNKSIAAIAVAVGVLAGIASVAAANVLQHGDDGPSTTTSHDMPGMTAAEMKAMNKQAKASRAEVAFLFPDGNDRGWSKKRNGEQHNMGPAIPLTQLSPPIRAELQRQLDLTLDAVRAYPTVAAAEAAGYKRQGPFTPGLGAHYIGGGQYMGSGPITDQQIVHPSSLVYDGTQPDSALVGFMYIAVAPNPEGFAGPNDHWHTHAGICSKANNDGTSENLGADGSITKKKCTALGGSWMATSTSLLHVWTAPAYSDPLGVFAHLNPAVTCGDGSYYTTKVSGSINQCRHP